MNQARFFITCLLIALTTVASPAARAQAPTSSTLATTPTTATTATLKVYTPPAETAHSALINKAFVTVDPQTGLFRNAAGLFVTPSVTYVQTSSTVGGTNNGPIAVLAMDPVKFQPDFHQMRQVGIRAIYMRIAPGLFLNPDGSWRKPQDPFTGVPNAPQVQAETLARLDNAAKAGIGPFTYTYEVFDYLLDVAAAEGIYVVPMILDVWDFPRKYDLHDSYVSILYQDLWEKTIQDWVKILTRYKDRKVIIGYLVEGETLYMPIWSESMKRFLAPGGVKDEIYPSPVGAQDPEVRRAFQEFLQRRYGTIQNLKNTWRYGYDRTAPTFDPKDGTPHYPLKAGVFDSLTSFSQIALPAVERSNLDKDMNNRGDHCPYWANVPFDPGWIDFAYFKDWLYTTRLNQLFARIRQVDPNHLFVHNAAGDFVPVWHPFFVPWNHGELDADVILHGNGYPEVVLNPALPITLTPSETVKELYQTVATYRPFKRGANGAAKAFGMGEGGLDLEFNDPKIKTSRIPEDLQERWVTSILMDNFGSGSAFASLWDWSSFNSITLENPKIHEHLVLRSIAQLNRAIERDTFTRGRQARVLILGNGPALHSLLGTLIYFNNIALSNALATTHCAFDTVSSDEISPGPKPGKVDISQYDAIFIPVQYQIPQQQIGPSLTADNGSTDTRPAVWPMLDQWLAAKPNRVLCAGLTMLRDAYFNPLPELPAEVRQVLGNVSPGPLGAPIFGDKTWTIATGGQLAITLDGARTQTLGVAAQDAAAPKPFLTEGEQVLGVKRARSNGSAVYTFGFPLGLSWTSSMDPEIMNAPGLNTKMDVSKLAAFYAPLLTQAGIAPDYTADPSVVAYISDKARVVLVRQRYETGPRKGVTLASPHFTRQIFEGATTTLSRKGAVTTGTLTCDLGEANYAAMLTEAGKAELAGDGSISVELKRDPAVEGKPATIQVKVSGNVAAHIAFEPGFAPPAVDYVPGAPGTTVTLTAPLTSP